jgi:succinyl-CoA synthetase beta subunit
VNLDTAGVQDWYTAHAGTSVHIGGQDGLLHTFLVERYVPHTAEYYVAISTHRDHDVIYFSAVGGVDIEENWDSVHTYHVPIQRGETRNIPTVSTDTQIQGFVQSLYSFFVAYGFAYLEVNPFTIDAYGDIVCLDMVARIDDSEAYRQKANW